MKWKLTADKMLHPIPEKQIADFMYFPTVDKPSPRELYDTYLLTLPSAILFLGDISDLPEEAEEGKDFEIKSYFNNSLKLVSVAYPLKKELNYNPHSNGQMGEDGKITWAHPPRTNIETIKKPK